MANGKLTPITYRNYITVIGNSIGSRLFRNFYIQSGGKIIDIMKDGELSCAFYVSSILSLFKLIKEPHATVDATIKDFQKSGWKTVRKPKIGSVLIWEQLDFENENDAHKHIGFYIGDNMAISNNYKLGYPAKHDWIFRTKRNKVGRRVEMILWNSRLANIRRLN